MGDLPDGGDPKDTGVPRIQDTDYKNLSDSYGKVPPSTECIEIKPKMDIKLDPERDRVDQFPQMRFSKKAVDGLRDSMIPKYDLKYLNDVDVSQEYKDVVRDDKKSITNQVVETDLKNITQEKIPEFRTIQDTKVESVQGSFTNLPTASTYTKYIMRQYRPDSARQRTITSKSYNDSN